MDSVYSTFLDTMCSFFFTETWRITCKCLRKFFFRNDLIDEFNGTEGKKEGIREGLKAGLKEGIQALIVTCKELGADFDRTEDKVKQRFHLSDADAAENMRLYW